ncbi:hypothetical protein AGR1B_Cc120466 [Agrobacterium fabacearum S56]|nr:hypothetical protein AGR1B_Cc120466 [Agrobacterium fabacearum S56]
MPPCGGRGTIVTSFADVNKSQRFPGFSSTSMRRRASPKVLPFRLNTPASWGKPENRFQMIPATLATESGWH